MIGVLLGLGLAGCGVVYTAPSVRDGAPLGQASGTEYDVEVIRLTEETARAANLTPYVPPRLPLAYQPGAASKIASGAGLAPAALAPLPEPTELRATRPGLIPDRLPPAGQPEPYRIGPADVVLLSVSTPASVSDLPGLISAQAKRQGYVVQDDGAIAIPDVGRVQIGGMTIQDAEAELFRALVAAGIDPSFSLEIAEFNSQRISVGGEVGAPQLVPITLKPLYLHEALQSAGGLTVADPSVARIQLFRGGEAFQIGVERFLSDPAARRILLRDGDSVFVLNAYREDAAARYFEQQLALRQEQAQTTAYALQSANLASQAVSNELARIDSEREAFQQRLALGAVEQHYAYVTGEVRRAQRVALPFERTANLADVLFGKDVAGMDLQSADMGEIYVIRAASDPRLMGKLTAWHLDAENAVNLAAATRFEMHPNDVVFVAQHPITAWNRVISQVLPQFFLQAAAFAATN
ncbi:MAG: polysaccharide biosynthesis/export family protein [Thermohalobaculum sp.]|nr:polysaccharide biosynthesis/export family protein [Thermohalobaculum sp.]